jgi:hypothetical protein
MPNVAPFDVFEIAWSLWNLSLNPDLANAAKLKPHVDFLSKAWEPKRGVALPPIIPSRTATIRSWYLQHPVAIWH